MTYEQALAWLDQRVNREAVSAPDAAFKLEGVRELMSVMADPQRQYPVLHLTGTNGKTSTARILTALLEAKGLSVGTFTSPHLERVNERMTWNGEPISDGAFAEVVTALAELEPLLHHDPTWFELVTAAALRWFSDIAVDAAVIEVGLGGRYDATNVADGQVAVVTNVGTDHVEFIGPTREDIAHEKAGIVKPGSTLVLGETDPAIVPIFQRAGAAAVWTRDVDFACSQNAVAHGGRLLGLRTPGAQYDDVYLPLHGAHQGDNAAVALAAAEAFFGEALAADVVAEALASVVSPGRMEIVGRRPLVILDGAHNLAGAQAAAATLDEEFATDGGRVIVFGCFAGKDPGDMLRALGAAAAKLVVAVAPPWPRALPASDIVAAATELGVPAVAAETVPNALRLAVDAATPADVVLVTGSLYLVGAAAAELREHGMPAASPG
ncbi:MAG: dihydrofolate synthase / folylpolyglutamate synthase [Actinomycetota bacterium]